MQRLSMQEIHIHLSDRNDLCTAGTWVECLHQWTGRSEDGDVVGTDRSGLEYLSGSGVYLRAASGCAEGRQSQPFFFAGGQRGMGWYIS